MDQNSLFENYKYCDNCGKPLPLTYKDSMCPFCLEQDLFHQVKDFIRANDVTEYDVAEHFHIPLHLVKKWIKEGRIEYKDLSDAKGIISNHCEHCGAPVTFGTLCPKCLKLMNSSIRTNTINSQPSHMRFLENAEIK